ncbi:hypothetical protein BDV98DRAFT_575011 [Pterulicium gracile]|uniref:Uncharacterized protein n=1 Tax=Pterulicium gracile TaxID=1884261 RepID=A0A5C3Q7M1_9AGAR|nr:hypothetical protein BDV98DRAFT_575011 [Pterula gracilis]
MQFKLSALVFAALAAVAVASPTPQQGTNCKTIFFPNNCSSQGQVQCDGSGGIIVCCDRCF